MLQKEEQTYPQDSGSHLRAKKFNISAYKLYRMFPMGIWRLTQKGGRERERERERERGRGT